MKTHYPIITSFSGRNIIWLFLLLSSFLQAQNVGIGLEQPMHKLDVAGNINLTGNLMVNGESGMNGQVLGMNGGTMQWMNKSQYQNLNIFTTSGNFTVPANTSQVIVEMWGAGGGAHNPGGGGGSGGYLIAKLDVTPSSTVTITIGTGGTGGGPSTNGTSGGLTQVVASGITLSAFGGSFADSVSSASLLRNVAGGGGLAGVTPTTFKNYFFMNGNPGVPTYDTYMAVSPTLYRVVSHLGVGGVAPFSGNEPDPVCTRFVDENGVLRWSSFSISNFKFGNGGSLLPNSTIGGQGGNGRVVIYY